MNLSNNKSLFKSLALTSYKYRSIISILLMLLTSVNLIGCASTKITAEQPTDGMITSLNIDTAIQSITDDTVLFLTQEFAPAKTRFNFVTATKPNDQFGINLKNQLRLKGFEISEKLEGSQYNNLKYVLDNNAQIIRLLIIIDNRNYSRCYSFTGEPISNWTLIKK